MPQIFKKNVQTSQVGNYILSSCHANVKLPRVYSDMK